MYLKRPGESHPLVNVIKPVLLSEFGPIQVYHYGEFNSMGKPTNVYYQCTQSYVSFGPFLNIEDAMASVARFTNVTTIKQPKSNVIQVDFRVKRRLN